MADAEIPCTAFDRTATNERNPLFTPPCVCPRCASEIVETSDDASPTMWLTVDGRPVRHDIENMDLGDAARELL